VLGVPESWVREHTCSGAVPHVPLGRYVRYDLDDVLAWVESVKAGGGPRFRRHHPIGAEPAADFDRPRGEPITVWDDEPECGLRKRSHPGPRSSRHWTGSTSAGRPAGCGAQPHSAGSSKSNDGRRVG
jgi:hypothetical protein